MFKVIEVRFDTLTGNESEHVLLKTFNKSEADRKCKTANVFFKNRIKFKLRLDSWAVVVEDKSPMWGGRLPGDAVINP